MTKLNEKAVELLGSLAKNKKTGNVLNNRVAKLVDFLEENEGQNIEIVTNNSWSVPPKKSQLKNYKHVGGTTYKYQIWAVIK